MKILIFTKNWLGDVLFETPAIKAIRQNYPSAHLVCATPLRCAEILKRNPYVNSIIPFDEKTSHRSLKAKWDFVLRLRKEKIDIGFLFHRSFTRALLLLLGGVKQRIGYATKGRSFLLTKAVKITGGKKHQVNYFLDLLKNAGLRVSVDPCCEFYFSREDEQKVSRFLQKKGFDTDFLIALNPGGNRSNKRWPARYFAQLADMIAVRYPCSFVVTGNQADDALATDISHFARKGRFCSLCGDTSLGELGAVFSRCRLVISGDSGPLHIAAGVGARVLALFGPTDPQLFSPKGYAKSTVIRSDSRAGYAMNSIKPDRVLETIQREKLLERHSR
ncbi:MAG TPA: lipopolysaccharide heptosyltransferase II [Candidatus Omnitrophota bacterium]|nr:lipopolysaccharide heptosyltransferase II [Candidatus Omnitrophota bacterium]